MPSSMLSLSRSPARLAAALLAALAIAAIPHERALAAALPAPPKTFDTSYAPPSGKTWPVAAGGNLQAALDQALQKDPEYAEAIANALVLQVIIGKHPKDLIEYVLRGMK